MTRPVQRPELTPGGSIPAALALGFAGLTFHNLREFPASVLWRGDTLILLAATVALGLWWSRRPVQGAASALLAWGLLHVIGGGLVVGGGFTVLVRDLAGADVSYDVSHHLSHWIYGLSYVPLAAMAWRARQAGGLRPDVDAPSAG